MFKSKRQLIIIFFLSISSLLLSISGFARTVQINFRNYTDIPLRYLAENTTFNSQIKLPPFVPSGTPSNGGVANGYVSNGMQSDKATGAFSIGYDSEHYCVFNYKMEKSGIRWTWYLQSNNFVGMDKVSCAVDPDAHTVVVFQTLGH